MARYPEMNVFVLKKHFVSTLKFIVQSLCSGGGGVVGLLALDTIQSYVLMEVVVLRKVLSLLSFLQKCNTVR